MVAAPYHVLIRQPGKVWALGMGWHGAAFLTAFVCSSNTTRSGHTL